MHRAGFVNIIGNPNVGKSTLMNALVGEKLSIVTAKAQTTRHRIMGIVSGEDFQIVYSDTPGILKPNYRLQENMMDFVDTAIGDADIILYVTDTVEKGDKNSEYIEKLRRVECPVVVVINKIDISTQDKVVSLMEWWKEQLPEAEIIPASAREQFNLESILDAVSSRLPEARHGSTRTSSPTRTSASSPRKSSGRRFSSTTARKSPTAARWRSRVSRKGRTGMRSAPSFMSSGKARRALSSGRRVLP